MSAKARAIFVTNNGLADHIGIAQVLPYLSGLAAQGHAIEIISVENAEKWDTLGQSVRTTLTDSGIGHYPIRRGEGLAGKLQRYAIPGMMDRRLAERIRAFRPNLLHCRSYMPLGPVMKQAGLAAIPFVFDMRGFWVDQRIEQGAWRANSLSGRVQIGHFRRLEAEAVRQAAQIVTLTDDAAAVVRKMPDYGSAPITTVPCSVDQDTFTFSQSARARLRGELGIAEDRPVLAYLGSASPLYRMDLVYRTFSAFRQAGHNPCLLMIGNHDPEAHRQSAAATGIEIPGDAIRCRLVAHNEVPAMLSAADIGMSYIISTPSSLGVSATKVGEYLACGLPVLSNRGIGDIERIIEQDRNGYVLPDESDASLADCVRTVSDAMPFDRSAIKEKARPYFSLEKAVQSYDRIYRELAA